MTYREEILHEAMSELVALRLEGYSEAQVLGDAEKTTLAMFWEEHDPSSTITGDDVAKLFPCFAAEWESRQ